MPILIIEPVLSTKIFIALLVLAWSLTLRRRKNKELFPLALTQELKGLAILAVVFSHVGYFLSASHNFLFPLSIMGGVGVNLFLFLSGYGLTASALKENLPAGKFYKKRLLRLFAPFWIVILIFFLLDHYFLQISYSWPYIIQSGLGLFPRADVVLDVNSPFWFLTPMLFYYVLFPWVFLKKRPWLTALLIYAVSYFILKLKLPVSVDLLRLYKLHLLAFPLGMAFAWLFSEPHHFARLASDKIKYFLYNFKSPQSLKIFYYLAYYAVLAALLLIIGYTAYYSGVGESPDKEQAISLITMGAIILFFMMKKFEIKFLYFFGLGAYEIYLIHWPLLSRYDILFKNFPGWLALVVYLGLFLILAQALKKFIDLIHRIKFVKS